MTAQPPLLLRRKTTKKQLISIYPKLEELLEANLVSVCVRTRVQVCVHVPCCPPPHFLDAITCPSSFCPELKQFKAPVRCAHPT